MKDIFLATAIREQKEIKGIQIGRELKLSMFMDDVVLYIESPKWSEVKSLSRVRLFATPWTVVHHASPSMGFSRQEYWSGLPYPSPEDLPNPGLPHCKQDTLPSEPPGKSSESPKDTTKKLLEFIREFAQVSEYNISNQERLLTRYRDDLILEDCGGEISQESVLSTT